MLGVWGGALDSRSASHILIPLKDSGSIDACLGRDLLHRSNGSVQRGTPLETISVGRKDIAGMRKYIKTEPTKPDESGP